MRKGVGKIERLGIGNADVRIDGVLYRSAPIDPTLSYSELMERDNVAITWVGERPRIAALVSDRVIDPVVAAASSVSGVSSAESTVIVSADMDFIADDDGVANPSDGEIIFSGGLGITTSAAGKTLYTAIDTAADLEWSGRHEFTSTYTYPSTYPFSISGHGTDDTNGAVQLFIFNDEDGTGYSTEVHIALQPTVAARRYLDFRGPDGVADWYVGVNASDEFIVYDTAGIHALTRQAGGDFLINSFGTGAVKVNAHSADTPGTGGFIVYSGGAPSQSQLMSVTSGAFQTYVGTVTFLRNADADLNVYFDSGSTASYNQYFYFRDRGSLKFFMGRKSNNDFALYDYTNSVYPIYWDVSEQVFTVDGDLDIDGGLEFQGSAVISTLNDGEIDLSPDGTGHVTINSDLEMDGSARIYEEFVSGAFGAGYALEYDGSGSYLEVDHATIRGTLRTHIFQYDVVRATNGYLFITDATEISYPASGSYIYCKENVFQAGDLLWYKDFDVDAGSISEVKCTVTSADGGYSLEGQTHYRFTVSVDSGSLADMDAGGTIVRVGSTSDTDREGSLYFDASSTYSPFLDVIDDVDSWSAFAAAAKTKMRMGQLEGITSTDEYGVYAGQAYSATGDDPWLVISDQTATFHNIALEMYNASTTRTIVLDPTNLYLGIGDDAPTGYLEDDGFWVGSDSGTYKAYLGSVSASELTAGLSWDGSALQIMGDLVLGRGLGFTVDHALLACHYDGPMPYKTDFQVNPTTHLGQYPTISGNVTGRPGRFAKALCAPEATTNKVTNPSAETDISGWNKGGVLDTFERVTTDSFIGSACFHMQEASSSGSNEYAITDYMSASASTDYSGQVRVKASGTQSVRLLLIWQDSGYGSLGSTEIGTRLEGDVDDWTIISGTATSPVGTAYVRLDVAAYGDVSGSYDVWFDAAQVEAKSYVTPIWDGSLMGSGSSTRVKSVVTYPDVPIPHSGTAAVWIYSEASIEDNNNFRWIFDANNTSGVVLYITNSDNLSLYINGATRCTLAVNDTNFPPQTWHRVVATWDRDASESKLYVDGVQVGSTGTYAEPVDDGNGWDVGHNVTNYQIPGYLDDVLILSDVWTASDVAMDYQSNRPFNLASNNYELLLTGDGRGKVIGQADGLFGYDADGNEAFALVTGAVTWAGVSLAAGDMMLGDTGTGKANLLYDQSAASLSMRINTTDYITLDSSGAYIDGDITVSATGTIYAGSNTWIDSGGISFASNTSALSTCEWVNGSTKYASIYAIHGPGTSEYHQLYHHVPSVSGEESWMFLDVDAPSGYQARFYIQCDNGTDSASLSMAGTLGSMQVRLYSSDILTLQAAGYVEIVGDVELDDTLIYGGLHVGSGTGGPPATGEISCAGTISTDSNATKWDLGGYASGAPTADGYVNVWIGGYNIRLLAEYIG